MNRNELVDRCKAIIKEAYEEATEMIVAYLELHPGEQLQSLCKEIDRENWNALRTRVQRAQDARKTAAGAESERTSTESDKAAVRHARRVLRNADPAEIAELLEEPEIRQNVAEAQLVNSLRAENRTGIPARNTKSTGPSFIQLVVRIQGWLDELTQQVEDGVAEIPAEFDTASLSNIGVRAMALKEAVESAREEVTA